MKDEKLKACPIPGCGGAAVASPNKENARVVECSAQDCLTWLPVGLWQALPRASESVLEVAREIQEAVKRQPKAWGKRAFLEDWASRLFSAALGTGTPGECSNCNNPSVVSFCESCNAADTAYIQKQVIAAPGMGTPGEVETLKGMLADAEGDIERQKGIAEELAGRLSRAESALVSTPQPKADAGSVLPGIVRDMWEHYEAMHDHTPRPTWEAFLAFTRSLESLAGGNAVDAVPSKGECALDCGTGDPPAVCLGCWEMTAHQDADSCEALEVALADAEKARTERDAHFNALDKTRGELIAAKGLAKERWEAILSNAAKYDVELSTLREQLAAAQCMNDDDSVRLVEAKRDRDALREQLGEGPKRALRHAQRIQSLADMVNALTTENLALAERVRELEEAGPKIADELERAFLASDLGQGSHKECPDWDLLWKDVTDICDKLKALAPTQPTKTDLPVCPQCERSFSENHDPKSECACWSINLRKAWFPYVEKTTRELAELTPCRVCRELPTVYPDALTGGTFVCSTSGCNSDMYTPAEWRERNKEMDDENQADSGMVRPVGGRILGSEGATAVPPADPVCGDSDSVVAPTPRAELLRQAESTPCRTCGVLPYRTTGGLDHINEPGCASIDDSDQCVRRKPLTPAEWRERNKESGECIEPTESESVVEQVKVASSGDHGRQNTSDGGDLVAPTPRAEALRRARMILHREDSDDIPEGLVAYRALHALLDWAEALEKGDS